MLDFVNTVISFLFLAVIIAGLLLLLVLIIGVFILGIKKFAEEWRGGFNETD